MVFRWGYHGVTLEVKMLSSASARPSMRDTQYALNIHTDETPPHTFVHISDSKQSKAVFDGLKNLFQSRACKSKFKPYLSPAKTITKKKKKYYAK